MEVNKYALCSSHPRFRRRQNTLQTILKHVQEKKRKTSQLLISLVNDFAMSIETTASIFPKDDRRPGWVGWASMGIDIREPRSPLISLDMVTDSKQYLVVGKSDGLKCDG
jgi:hypothetical protein